MQEILVELPTSLLTVNYCCLFTITTYFLICQLISDVSFSVGSLSASSSMVSLTPMHEEDDSVKFQSLKNIPLDDVDFGFNVPEETEADIDDFENQKFVEEQENKIIETEKLEKPLKSAKVGYICISIKS